MVHNEACWWERGGAHLGRRNVPSLSVSGSLHRRRTVGNWLGGVWHLLDGQTGKSTLSPTIRYLAGGVLMIMHLFLLFIYFLFF